MADILSINICVAIDTILNFDGDANADVKCEQALTTTSVLVGVALQWDATYHILYILSSETY